MTSYRKLLVGMTHDEAFACIMKLKTEEQADVLLEIADLRESDRGRKLMKTIAGPSGPSCRRLSEILAAHKAEAASAKAARIEKKARPKPARYVFPSLFDLFSKEASAKETDEKLHEPTLYGEEASAEENNDGEEAPVKDGNGKSNEPT